MVPENSAGQSVKRSRNIEYQSASERPPGAEIERHPPADNEAPHFLAMMVRAARAVNLLTKRVFCKKSCFVALSPAG